MANLIYDFDRKHTADPVTRSKVEDLIFEVSYKFLVNKNFNISSSQFKLIQMLNGDSDYQEYVLLCKIYMSLCQINKVRSWMYVFFILLLRFVTFLTLTCVQLL